MANEIVAANVEITPAITETKSSDTFICTFDTTTIEGKIKLTNALNGAVTMRDKVGETLRVVDIITKPGVRNRTGEVCVNTYLIVEDGTVYFSQSDGIAESVRNMATLVFVDPTTGIFVPPIEYNVGFVIREQVTQNGNTRKYVDLVKL